MSITRLNEFQDRMDVITRLLQLITSIEEEYEESRQNWLSKMEQKNEEILNMERQIKSLQEQIAWHKAFKQEVKNEKPVWIPGKHQTIEHID